MCVCGSILPFDTAVAFDVAAVTVVAVSVIDCISIASVVATVSLWIQYRHLTSMKLKKNNF